MNLAKFQVAIVGICLPLVLASCIPIPKNWECSQPSTSNLGQTAITQRSQPTNIAIQFDNTLSMQGFVKNANSRYNKTLDILANAITRAFNESNPKYYSFATTRKSLNKKQAYKDAQKLDFYDPQIQYAKLKTAIEPISDNSKNEFSMIVTDLYQTDSSEDDSVLNILKEKYIQKGNAVGILALKSEFDGFVYDVGRSNQKYPYKTNSNISSYHPFYVILLGTYENIAHYFDQLKKNDAHFLENEYFMIFYPSLSNEKMVLNIDNKQRLPEGIERQKTINNGKVVVEVNNFHSTDLLKINRKFDAEKGIAYQIKYSPLPYALEIEPTAKTLSSLKFQPEKRDFVGIPESLQFSQWQVENDTISFLTEVNSIKEPGVYKFIVNILPDKLKYQEWWKKWNFGESEGFDGSKTYNLLPFFQGLSDITLQQVQSSNYSIGHLCYVIHKE